MKVCIPKNLYFENITLGKKAKIDFLYYLVSKVIDLSLRENLIIHDGMVPLWSKILKRHEDNYKDYLKYLVKHGVFKEEKSADLNNHTCNRYGLTDKYKNQELIERNIDDKYSRFYEFPDDFFTKLKVEQFLKGNPIGMENIVLSDSYLMQNEWLQNINILDDVYNCEEYVSSKRNTRKFKRNFTKISKIRALKDGNIQSLTSRDTTSFRFHSPLTSLNRDFRKYLRCDNEILGQIDIKNSQPFFLIALLNEKFWYLDNPPLQRFLNDKIERSTKKGLLSLSEVTKGLKQIDPDEKALYIKLVKEGTFYDYLLDKMKTDVKTKFKEEIDRDSAKKLFLWLAYVKNTKQYSPVKSEWTYIYKPVVKIPKHIFKDNFKTINSFLYVIKKHCHKRLPIILQHIESHCVLDLVYKRLVNEHPNFPCYTIHDSIVSLPEHLTDIKEIMREEITNYTGYEPTLKEEIWN